MTQSYFEFLQKWIFFMFFLSLCVGIKELREKLKIWLKNEAHVFLIVSDS